MKTIPKSQVKSWVKKTIKDAHYIELLTILENKNNEEDFNTYSSHFGGDAGYYL